MEQIFIELHKNVETSALAGNWYLRMFWEWTCSLRDIGVYKNDQKLPASEMLLL